MLERWVLVGKLVGVVWRVVGILRNSRVGVWIHRLKVGVVWVDGWQKDIWTRRRLRQIWLVGGGVLKLSLIVRSSGTLLSRTFRSEQRWSLEDACGSIRSARL